MGPDGKDVYIPVKDLLPMLEPNDIEFDGKYNIALSSLVSCINLVLQVGILTLPVLPRLVKEQLCWMYRSKMLLDLVLPS